MKTFDCACGVRLEADADDDLVAVARQHADEQHGGDPMYSDMELEAEIVRGSRGEAGAMTQLSDGRRRDGAP